MDSELRITEALVREGRGMKKIIMLAEWQKMSTKGQRCGILGCVARKALSKCPFCEFHYCEEHKKYHFHPVDRKAGLVEVVDGRTGLVKQVTLDKR